MPCAYRNKLIAVVKQGREQLEAQMAQERAERDARLARAGGRVPGWDADDAPVDPAKPAL
jgi:hypothetical protein